MNTNPFSTIVRIGFLAAGILLASGANIASAKIIYVSTIGNDANDGLSWATAKLTVSAGLTTAATGDQVWVAAGTYVENITLKADVSLYGGFAGSETSLSQRNWAINKTILDGNKTGSVVTSPAEAAFTTRIDGFTIRNGISSSGGGIRCLNSSPTIANNTISGNRADDTGGGVYCASTSSPLIANNTIRGNIATYGGGIFCSGSSPKIVNNTITGNNARTYGGGIFCSFCSPMIHNTIIAFNSPGIYILSGSPVFNHNCVYGNTTYNYSGITDPTGTDGNISADPKMADVNYGNMHIQPDSPCVDAGDNAHTFGEFDMDGQSRIQLVGETVDIGADESDGTVWQKEPHAIIRVTPDGDDANGGSSWALAKRTVQAGINAASASGGEVWVQAGTYYERIMLSSHAFVYGGFAGTENALNERDWGTNITTLDGQQGGSVVTAQAGCQFSRIDGFTIRNGKAMYGSGINCSYSFPTITNNTLTDNIATHYGGGISCVYSSATIVSNKIIGNTAAYGGGIDCHYSFPTIANNIITGNGVGNNGGGIHCESSSPMIANNTITRNVAGFNGSGGISCFNSSAPTITNTIIAFNSSGIYNSAGSPVLSHNCVYGNTTYNYSFITDPTGTNGNISVDPKLACLVYGNAHIQPDSPCIDAGDNTRVSDSLDIDGQLRIQPTGGTVDIGADESDGTVWPAGPYVIVRVAPNGNDTNDGSSWAQARRTVQAGINAASASGGEVWVQSGTYYEQITLLPHAYVYGGFAGTEMEEAQRSRKTNVTTLDGQQGGSVVTVRTGYQLSRIDGFTIRNGSAPSGGGIYCIHSSPTIANNTIAGNVATSSGGGIYCILSSPMIINNMITGNSAHSYGGGIYCIHSSLGITNNTIAENIASSSGGGIYIASASPTIANTIVAFNSSGCTYSTPSNPTLLHNCVYGNTSANYSGITDPTGTNGNISADPRLIRRPSAGADGVWGTADDDYGDLSLMAVSPCIDAGSNANVPSGIVTDLAGRPRFIDDPAMPDTGSGTPPIVDMGAYEAEPALPSDFNRDNHVDADDFDVNVR